jgi:hypothetical protein
LEDQGISAESPEFIALNFSDFSEKYKSSENTIITAMTRGEEYDCK